MYNDTAFRSTIFLEHLAGVALAGGVLGLLINRFIMRYLEGLRGRGGGHEAGGSNPKVAPDKTKVPAPQAVEKRLFMPSSYDRASYIGWLRRDGRR